MNKKNKEIPTKNYLILIVLCLVTIVLTFNLSRFYKEQLETNNQNNNIMKFLSEIKEDELKNYILDNHEAIIYISSSANNDNKTFEKELKNYISKKNLTKEFVYIDISNVSENFYNDLKNIYLSEKLKKDNIDITIVPNIFIIKEEKIVKILYKTQPTELKVKQVEKFINENWIEE